MNNRKIKKYQQALDLELTQSILKKIELLKSKIELKEGSNRSEYLQILTMVDDDLDDVLLNWETSSFSTKLFGSLDLDNDDYEDD